MILSEFSGRWTTSAVLALALPSAAAQLPTDVKDSEVDSLVRGRTLAIAPYGDTTNSAMTFIWDFRGDGSLCARYAGAKRNAPCAEQGKWTTSGALLCWELPSLGRSMGLNSACSSIKREAAERFEFRNEKTPDLSFAKFLLLPK